MCKPQQNRFDIAKLEEYYKNRLLMKQTHPSLPLIIWNYSPTVQYDKLWDNITLKCRALITDQEGLVVAKSFDKFFNIEELRDIPNEPFDVYEKLDGSLIVIAWYKGEMVVASKASFNSAHSNEAKRILSKYDLSQLDSTKSYCAELIVKWNKIVCDYGDKEDIVLLAKFDNYGNEYDLYQEKNAFPIVKKYDGIKDLSLIKSLIKDDQEGFVIRFKSGTRIKIKGEEYVRLHRIVTGVTEKLILETLRNGHSMDVFLDKVPDEFYNWVKKVQKRMTDEYNEILNQSKAVYKEFPTRKEAAMYILQQKHPKVLFHLLDKKDPKDCIWDMIVANPKFDIEQAS